MRAKLVMWRLLTGKPDAFRGGFNRSIDASYKIGECAIGQMLTRTAVRSAEGAGLGRAQRQYPTNM